jgi:hypothetical protein
MDIELVVENVTVTPRGYKQILVLMEEVEESEVLDSFSIDQIIKHFKTEDLLDAIGQEEVMEYFDLQEKE